MKGKLVRDHIPSIIFKNDKIQPNIKTLSKKEFAEALRIKLLEEAGEVSTARNKKEMIGEIADVFEVLDALMILHGITRKEVTQAQKQKKKDRGGFSRRIYLIQ